MKCWRGCKVVNNRRTTDQGSQHSEEASHGDFRRMEKNLKKNVCGLLVPDTSEDSVDIYDGLDGSVSDPAAKSPLRGRQLKESMDLYEELVTEEEQNKEASYSELKSRFQAAQNQIQELRRRLEQMEMQNTGLTSENCCLKKNISVLLQTARLEVKRKDAEILRLNQWSSKAFYRPQPSHGNPRDPNQPNASSEASSLSRPPLPAPPPPPPLPPAPRPSCPPPPIPPLPALPRRPDHLPRDLPQPSRRESAELTRASKPSSHSHSKRDHEVADAQTLSDKHRSKCSEENYQGEKLSESTDKRHRKLLNPSKDCHVSELNRLHRADGRRHDPRLPKSRSSNKEHGKTTGAKSLPLESSHKSDKRESSGERRPDKMATSAPDQASQQRSKESHNQDRERRNRASDKHRSSDTKEHKKSSHNAERHRESSKEREANRHKSHQRKEDRRHDQKTDRKHSRSGQSEASNEHEKRRPRELSWGKVEVCGKDNQEKPNKETRMPSEKSTVAEKTNVDENSSNRKLSFMETLNLTLSPIKKSGLSVDACQGDLLPVEEDPRKTSDEDTSQPDFEDMCIIDEVDNSECEAGPSEVMNQSVDHPEASCSEKTPERSGRKDAAEEKKSEMIHSTSEQSQPLNTAQSQATVSQRPSSPESTSSTAVADPGSHQDTINLATDSKPEAKDDTNPSKTSESVSKQHVDDDLQRTDLHIINDSSAALREPAVLHPSLELPKSAAPQSTFVASPPELPVTSSPTETKTVEDEINKSIPEGQQSLPAAPPPVSQPGPGPGPQKESGGGLERSKDTDAVTSTISLESLPKEGLSLTEAIYVLTQTEDDASAEPSSSTGCIGVSAVSSTTEEKAPPDCYNVVAATPKKTLSPGRKWQSNMEPSSSVPAIYDEDSMMRTLSNLKRIPDAISPLRSPVQISKRHLSHAHGKPGHVKSLQKDFSSGTIDASSTKLDVNKENKYPGSPTNRDTQNFVEKVSDVSSSPSDSDLEEGEILSESDEQAACPSSPPAKRPKLTKPVRNKPSTNCILKKKSDERGVVSKEPHETAGASTRSPKGRFKTVCPAATKASFSTTEEVMEAFKVVRGGIRRKYMKLHKSFPKKSFYGVMENFQESFLEFVDGAHFGQICSQSGELKSKLKNLITSVFGKVSNNGIVKRIFEQQAVDMKQKLWDFVDAQVNYLFREIETALKGTCKTSQVEARRTSRVEKVSSQSPTKKPQCKQKEAPSEPFSLNRTRLCAYKTGLGSRGKDIRITHGEIERGVHQHPPNGQSTHSVVEVLPPKSIFLTPEKNNASSLVVSQNGQLVDKTDFQLLTEQQASSLTFNLVRDSQMGEIFKCLLQGSDFLEGSGDNGAWTLGTPRKDGERFISISTPSKFESPSKLLSPTKFETPSKLVATWASISPRKVSSPCLKDPLNPALFDESCLLEVPSENPVPSQKTYSILAEDLAVSLTIPSPLKSDSHLSFLQPSTAGLHLMSTPDSVISAHISEDALMDGEDATEQDIHLALDTDNSSCNPSSSSGGSSPLATPFVFKSDVPMQALVMEKSNDHFILKIRQASTSGSVTLSDEYSCDQNRSEKMQQKVQGTAAHGGPSNSIWGGNLHNCANASHAPPSDHDLPNQAAHSELSLADNRTTSCLKLPQINNLSLVNNMFQQNTSKEGFSNQSATNLHKCNLLYNSLNAIFRNSPNCTIDAEDSLAVLRKEMTPGKCGSEALTHKRTSSPSQAAETDTPLPVPPENPHTDLQSQAASSQVSAPEKDEADVSKPKSGSAVAGDTGSSPKNVEKDPNKRKRKKHQKKSKAKRSKEGDKETPVVTVPDVRRDDEESRSSQTSLSPTSLSAKNVIRKKGEVVVTWTREEDRAILVALKTKGASRDTFSILSEKLQKPSEQVAHRFHQLMKLFKKMDP